MTPRLNTRLVTPRSPLSPLSLSARPLSLCRAVLLGMTVACAAGMSMSSAQAQTPAAIRPSPTASADAAVKAAVESTIAAIGKDPAAMGGDPDRTAQLVTTYFLPYTDFQRTARLATGDYWKKATPEQQKQIAEQFQALLVRVYAAQLTQVQGQHISFKYGKPTAVPNSTDQVVQSDVHTDTDDMSTSYRLVKTADGYKIYDIDLMGLWLIQVYRQQFGDQLRQGGIDGLIKFLAAHNAQRAGG
jgi:ABC-type transporter MlaC component